MLSPSPALPSEQNHVAVYSPVLPSGRLSDSVTFSPNRTSTEATFVSSVLFPPVATEVAVWTRHP